MKVSQRMALFFIYPEVKNLIIRIKQLDTPGSQNNEIISSIFFKDESSNFQVKRFNISSKISPQKLALIKKSFAPLSLVNNFCLSYVSFLMQMASKRLKVIARQKQLPSLRVLRQVEKCVCRFCTLLQKPQLLMNQSSMREIGLNSLIKGDSASTSILITLSCYYINFSCSSYQVFSFQFIYYYYQNKCQALS